MNIRFFVILLSCALFGLLVMQFNWLKMAFNTQKERFRQQVHSGLSEVARKLDEREVIYDVRLLAQNQDENVAPQNLCINEDSLIKPKKMAENTENNIINIAQNNYNNEIERLHLQKQTAKAEMEILRAEKMKKELIAQKNALNESILKHKAQMNASRNFPADNSRYNSYGINNFDTNKNNATNYIIYPLSSQFKKPFPTNKTANIIPQKSYIYEKNETEKEDDFGHEIKIKINANTLNEEELLRNLEKLGNLGNMEKNLNAFEKKLGAMGNDFEENFGREMEKFGKAMEEFGKEMERLDFEIVNAENIIRTQKGGLVLSLGNFQNLPQKQQKNLQRELQKRKAHNKNARGSDQNAKLDNNYKNRRDNKSYAFNYNNNTTTNRTDRNRKMKDTIRKSFNKGENFGVIVKGNTNKVNIQSNTDCEEPDCEIENDFFEQHNAPDPLPTELPKEVSHFQIAQNPVILPNQKITSQIREKDEIIKHVLENFEETKKNPNQILETRQKLEDRLRFELLDSLIKAEMRLRGIDIPYNFVVERRSSNDIQRLRNPKMSVQLASQETLKGDSLHKIFFEKNVNATNDIIKAGFSTPIFVLQNTGNRYFLHLNFAQQHSLLFRNMIEMLLSSLALIALVIYCFVKAIRTILKQKKMSEMTTDFINNMTHELKTPIATVALACEALQDKDIMDKLPHQRSRYINMIQEENQRLQTQVEKVLHIAKLDKGEISLQYEQVDLNEILPDITAQMALQVETKGGKIELELQATNNILHSDKNHLSHIILNLLDNANKYSPEQPNILVKTQDTETGVKISVTDHGQGMTKDQQCKVFDKFYRVSTGNVHNVKGFGLGLSYVKTMTEALGGKVSVKSELGKGSTFEVEFKK